ncbi:MAG: zincin-like metallopeptidase domain-containing protein [Acidobacteria bacterium]|nr:zincin-like metallopeptidase domain-containing protein [Acidobacteriota bacterium]
MATGRERADEYHQQFAERIIQALKEGTAPWQKPWKPGERVLPHNFGSGRDYRGGNAMFLTMQQLDRGYADPRWGGYRQIQEAGGHVRKGEKGTPILYVEWRQRRTARDERGNPVLDENGQKKLEWVQRDRPLVKVQHVFNVEQAEGLKLRSLDAAAPEWEGHERAEAVMRGSGVRIDHVAGDRAFYRPSEDRIVLPERSQFASQSAYTHTALHELGHATGHPDRLNRPTLNNHGGFGAEDYAREELRAEIAAMMTGEKLGVGHEPRHGTAYVSSWIKALENDPREIRAAAVDAQRMSDWLLARERTRTVEEEQHRGGPDVGGPARTPGREVSPDRGDGALVVPVAGGGVAGQPDETRDTGAPQPLPVGGAPRSAPGDGDREGWSRSQDTGPSR